MHDKVTINDIIIRTELKPGDIGFVIHRHGKLYHEEYGYGIAFEAYVAIGLFEFYENMDPVRDRAWICEHANTIIGFALLMHRENNQAQLRYFYIEPPYRGIGLGKKLLSMYMEFLKSSGYASSYLWTTHELNAAASLYKRHGFQLTEEKANKFGKLLKEQRYEVVI